MPVWRRAARLVRSLVRAPAYTLGVVVTLGLGAGVTAASLSVIRAVFLAPLPHARGERLVYLRQSAPGGDVANALFSVPEIREYRTGVAAFRDVAEFSSMRFTARGLDRPREIRAGVVTANYFRVLGLDAEAGRVIGPGDAGERADPVMVLTAPFWRRVFGGDTSAVGRTVEMDGRPVTIVGVAEPHPPYPERTDVYVNLVASPHHLSATMSHGWTHRMTEAFARLGPRATIEAARSQVAVTARRLRADHPEAYDRRLSYRVRLRTLSDQLTHRARPVLWILLGTAGSVLLVALANAANLALARADRLRGELAVRASLGASGPALRRRLVSENALLGLAGAAVGVGVGSGALGLLSSYASRFTVRAGEIGADPGLVLIPTALALGASLGLAFLPRLPAGGSAGWITHALGLRGASSAPGPGGGRGGLGGLQGVLVSAQVAASLTLVTSAVLLARTLVNLESVDAGMDTAEVVAMDVPVLRNGRTRAEIRDDYAEMARALERTPGVARAAVTNVVPFRQAAAVVPWIFEFRLDGAEAPAGAPPYRADFRTVTAGYFETVGIRVVAGRAIAPSDDAAAPPVAVVNEAFVRAFLEGRDPLGRRVAWTGDAVQFAGVSGADRTIVGVAADARDRSPERDPSPAIYMPHLQEPWGAALLARAADDGAFPGQGERMARRAARVVRSVVPGQPVENFATLEEARRATFGDSRLNARLVSALALVALLVAGVGVFAAVAYSVGRRAHEIGVRMAFGADATKIVAHVLGKALHRVGAGLLLGLVASWLLSRTLRGLLYGVAPADPAALLLGSGAMLTVAVAAALVPALRATRVDPVTVLAGE